MNFLTDEAADGGKGANAVISRLHHYFEQHGLGEDEAFLHADNCAGQNKNNAVMQYLMWQVMKRLHRCITISFLIVGHTKFSPNWCFRLFKKYSLMKTFPGCSDTNVKWQNFLMFLTLLK